MSPGANMSLNQVPQLKMLTLDSSVSSETTQSAKDDPEYPEFISFNPLPASGWLATV